MDREKQLRMNIAAQVGQLVEDAADLKAWTVSQVSCLQSLLARTLLSWVLVVEALWASWSCMYIAGTTWRSFKGLHCFSGCQAPAPERTASLCLEHALRSMLA